MFYGLGKQNQKRIPNAGWKSWINANTGNGFYALKRKKRK